MLLIGEMVYCQFNSNTKRDMDTAMTQNIIYEHEPFI